MKKIMFLFLLVISVFCFYNVDANETNLDLTEDIDSSSIVLQDGMIIDGKGFTISGSLSVPTGYDLTIKNVTIDGEGAKDILIYIAQGGNITIDNVKFQNYTKAGIYAESFDSLVVTNCVFDATDTANIGDYTGPEAEERKRSAAGIDLNLGNGGKTIDVQSINISNNTFKNVVATTDNSTAGAIKIKVKDASNLVNIGSVNIAGNTFTDNVRDIVIGTNSPASGTTQADTGNFDITLSNNGTIKFVNNSLNLQNEEDRTEILDNNTTDYIVNAGLNDYQAITNEEPTGDINDDVNNSAQGENTETEEQNKDSEANLDDVPYTGDIFSGLGLKLYFVK